MVACRQRTCYGDALSRIDEMLLECADLGAALRTQPERRPTQAQAARLQALRGGTAGVSASLRKDHKEMHSLVSKLGKAIDAHTHPSLATVFDPEAFSGAEQTALINAAIAQHLCREQRFETSDMFVEEAGVEPAPREGRELRAELSALHAAAEGLREGQSFAALAWASSHNLGSAFAFELHKLRYVALLRGGDSRAALAYLRRPDAFLTPSEEAGEEQRRELRRLVGALAFCAAGALDRSPYSDLLAPEHAERTHREMLDRGCAALGLPAQSPLATVLHCGGSVLPRLLKYMQVVGASNAAASRDEPSRRPRLGPEDTLPLELELPARHQYGSRFVCPVTRELSSAANPPTLLRCGHVIGGESVAQMAQGQAGRFKCPYCPVVQSVADCIPLSF